MSKSASTNSAAFHVALFFVAIILLGIHVYTVTYNPFFKRLGHFIIYRNKGMPELLRTIEQVPLQWRAEVQALLDAE